MNPAEIIRQLKEGKAGTGGRVILSQPITNFPVADSDYQAAHLMDYILEHVLTKTATLEEILKLLAETQWWFMLTEGMDSNVKELTAWESSDEIKKTVNFIAEEIFQNKWAIIDVLIVIAEAQWWLVFFAAMSDGRPFEQLGQVYETKFGRLRKVDHVEMLRKTLRLVKNLRSQADLPAWSVIGELCNVGSTDATFIGLELKIDPSAKLKDAINHYDQVKKKNKVPA